LRAELAKLAARSIQLRAAVLRKESGVLSAVSGGALKVFKAHPIAAPLAGLGLVGGASDAASKYKQYKSGFDPNVQKGVMGQAPVSGG
jgi:hypothetical protein